MRESSQGVVGTWAEFALVGAVQGLRFEGCHINAGRAIIGAGFTAQAQIQGVVKFWGGPAIRDHATVEHFWQGTSASSGGVFLIAGCGERWAHELTCVPGIGATFSDPDTPVNRTA